MEFILNTLHSLLHIMLSLIMIVVLAGLCTYGFYIIGAAFIIWGRKYYNEFVSKKGA